MTKIDEEGHGHPDLWKSKFHNTTCVKHPLAGSKGSEQEAKQIGAEGKKGKGSEYQPLICPKSSFLRASKGAENHYCIHCSFVLK